MQEELRGQLIDLIPELRRHARHLAGSRSDADDLLHSTLEKALRKLDTYQPTGPFRGWLIQIMRNCFIDGVRRDRILPPPPREWVDTDDLRPVQADQFNKLHLKELAREIAQLPEAQRSVLTMFAEGTSYEEAAAQLGVPVGTVRSRLFRARETLRQRVDNA